MKTLSKPLFIFAIIISLCLLFLVFAYLSWGYFTVGEFSYSESKIKLEPFGSLTVYEGLDENGDYKYVYHGKYEPNEKNIFMNSGEYRITFSIDSLSDDLIDKIAATLQINVDNSQRDQINEKVKNTCMIIKRNGTNFAMISVFDNRMI